MPATSPDLPRPILLAMAARIETGPLLTSHIARPGPAGVHALPTSEGEIYLVVAGVGGAGDERLCVALGSTGARSVINIGFAGALAPDLPPGATVLGDPYLRKTSASAPESTPASGRLAFWIDRQVAEDLELRTGPMLTVDAPFHDRADGDRLHRETGALAVEMESARWARIAAAAGAEFVALRVISDRADLRLPLPRHHLLRADGSVRWGAWVRALAVRDALWHVRDELAKLQEARRDWVVANRRLEQTIRALVTPLGLDLGAS